MIYDNQRNAISYNKTTCFVFVLVISLPVRRHFFNNKTSCFVVSEVS